VGRGHTKLVPQFIAALTLKTINATGINKVGVKLNAMRAY